MRHYTLQSYKPFKTVSHRRYDITDNLHNNLNLLYIIQMSTQPALQYNLHLLSIPITITHSTTTYSCHCTVPEPLLLPLPHRLISLS